MAEIVATRSTCSRLHVGCVLTDADHAHVTVGYNGGPRGGRNECRRDTPGNCGHVHAEINAIAKARGIEQIAYVTHAPCESCAVMLVNAGIRKVFYGNPYRDPLPGLKVFAECGVRVHHMQPGSAIWEDAWAAL